MGKKTWVGLMAGLASAVAFALTHGPSSPAGLGLRLSPDAGAGTSAWWHGPRTHWHLSGQIAKADGGATAFRLSPTRRGLSLRPLGSGLALQRNRTLLAAHWQPLSLGAWKLGTSLGYVRGLGGEARRGLSAMPMATLERPGYCVNLGLLPARGERDPSLFMGVSLPLQ